MGLRASGHALNLMALYLVTLIMRASFYLSIAVIQDPTYMGTGLTVLEIGAVLIIYPLAELISVSFFGSYSDKIGRRPILIASLFITGISAFLFAIAPSVIFLLIFSAVFGIGAASKVSTTLSMIADMSSEDNRARLMGYYDLSTIMGLAGGYGLGILLIEFGWTPFAALAGAGTACAFSGIIALVAIKETRTHVHVEMSMLGLIRKVASDKRIQKLIPVYVPIISMYGIFIGYTKYILSHEFSLSSTELIVLFGLLGGALLAGIIVNGHLSDHYRKRRPFIVIGLIGFGLLGYLLVANVDSFAALWAIWPVLPILGFTAGAFPPAAMAYLTDISEEKSRGTTMGVYSIFFGSGMIIGPAAGAIALEAYGLPGMALLVAIIILIAVIGTVFMPEVHEKSGQDPLT
ncbi:MAG: MFS transporter [Candidatus Thorarchaeota archaeon]|jgi:DHA1 family multidrug resistance protein-like MFS transporter